MRFSRIRSRVSSSGACSRDQLVEGRLGVEHHRPELAAASRRPARSNSAGSTGARLVAELRQAERVGEPLRRVDREHRDLLARAPPSRRRSPPRWSSCRRRPSRRRCRPACPRGARRRRPSADSSSASRCDLRRRRARARRGTAASRPGADDGSSQARELLALGARRAVLGERRPARGARRRRRRRSRARSSSRSASCVAEALRVEAVHVDAVDRDADLARRASRSSAAVSLTGISSGSATIATPVCVVVGDEARRAPPPGAWIGPTRAMSAKVRGVCRKPIPWPVAGASTITRSYLRALLHLAVGLGQLPDLPDRDQLLAARAWRRRGR